MRNSPSLQVIPLYLRLIITAYSLSIVWLLLSRIYLNSESEETVDFDQVYRLEDLSSSQQQITVFYFVSTTITKVGLGDIVPLSDSNRVLCIPLLAVPYFLVASFLNYFLKRFSKRTISP